jgi:predicted dehydrogenase
MRILVVGLGSMGRRRLRCLTHIGGHDLAGLEPSAERAAAVGEEFSMPTFPSFEEALKWEPEALVISTPPDLHLPFALQAARHGLHFFTEASVVPEDTTELEALADQQGIVAAPSCTMRFHPAVGVLRRRIEEGAVGRVLAVTHHVGQYLPDWHPWEDYRNYYVSKRETGAAREIVPFELNWMAHLFGPVTAIAGFQGKLSSLEVDIDDLYSQLVAFGSGVQGTLVVEVVSRPAIRQARIVGEDGTLIWDWNDRCVREWTAASGEWITHEDPAPIAGPGGDWVSENMYIAEMEGYLAAIGGDRAAYPFSLAEDRHLLGALAAAERSWAERSWVDVDGAGADQASRSTAL